FQWRFSREETHSRQRKSKGKRSARDKQQAEENEKNLEDQFPKAGDVGNCVLGTQQWGRASEESEEGVDPLELELQMFVSHYVGADNQSQILNKSSQCS
ncbi:hypothetical protein STEG23_010596, partial [Scotinomys teguina]